MQPPQQGRHPDSVDRYMLYAFTSDMRGVRHQLLTEHTSSHTERGIEHQENAEATAHGPEPHRSRSPPRSINRQPENDPARGAASAARFNPGPPPPSLQSRWRGRWPRPHRSCPQAVPGVRESVSLDRLHRRRQNRRCQARRKGHGEDSALRTQPRRPWHVRVQPDR